MTSLPLVPPQALAWLRHRAPDGSLRLGLAQPSTDDAGDRTVALYDVGPLDPADALGAPDGSGLQSEHLRKLLDSAVPLSPTEIQFEAPLDRPSKILCLGKNFAAHAAEFGADVPEEPIFFTKLLDTLSPHGAPVVLPHWVESRIDHEVELAVVLGFAGPPRKHVSREQAMDLVAGYSIFDDVTARRIQGDDRGQQRPWLRCKSFDTFGPFGPWVVPADALDPADLSITLRVDDELRQNSRTSQHVVDIPHAIEYLSRHTSLRSGDLLIMGTPAGVGPLHPGNVVRCAIEGIGELVHGVVREPMP